MPESLLSQGLSLLVYGMGTVLLFLGLLVVVTSALSKLLVKYLPEPAPVARVVSAPAQAASAAPTVDARTRAVIVAAIAQHRARQR